MVIRRQQGSPAARAAPPRAPSAPAGRQAYMQSAIRLEGLKAELAAWADRPGQIRARAEGFAKGQPTLALGLAAGAGFLAAMIFARR